MKKFNTEEVRLLVKALPFKTLYNLLGRDDVSSELGQLLLVEYRLRDAINKPDARVIDFNDGQKHLSDVNKL